LVSKDIGEMLRPRLEPLLEAGEELRGVLVATQQSAFKGRMVGIGVTPGRLLLLPLNRKLEPAEEPIVLTPERIAEARATGAGDDWYSVTAAVMDGAAVTLRLRTTDGETQGEGVRALAEWFAVAS
jgi:hypothetical protein